MESIGELFRKIFEHEEPRASLAKALKEDRLDASLEDLGFDADASEVRKI